MPLATAREELQKVPGVSTTWLEWSIEDGHWALTLVVEVNFDTDPVNQDNFNPSALDEIWDTAKKALDGGAVAISHLRVVPAARK